MKKPSLDAFEGLADDAVAGFCGLVGCACYTQVPNLLTDNSGSPYEILAKKLLGIGAAAAGTYLVGSSMKMLYDSYIEPIRRYRKSRKEK